MIKLMKGDVWESSDGVYRREVLFVHSDGGVLTETTDTRARLYRPKENINDQDFHKLISRSATIHAEIKEWKFVCMNCGKKFWTESPSVCFPVCSECENKTWPVVNPQMIGPPYNCRCETEPVGKCQACGKKWQVCDEDEPSEIDTVKVNQVWEGFCERPLPRRVIVEVRYNEDGKVTRIKTRRLDDESETWWGRSGAERHVLGTLIEYNHGNRFGTCKTCGKEFPISPNPFYIAICPECEQKAKAIKCVYCGKVTGHAPPLMSGSFSACGGCLDKMVPCAFCGHQFLPQSVAYPHTVCPQCQDEAIKNLKTHKPTEVKTKVWRAPSGPLEMSTPEKDGHVGTDWATVGVCLGRNGWALEGFEFEEDPHRIYPHAQGWVVIGSQLVKLVSMIKDGVHIERVIAKYAVWRKAKG